MLVSIIRDEAAAFGVLFVDQRFDHVQDDQGAGQAAEDQQRGFITQEAFRIA